MNIVELFLRVLSELRPMLPGMIVAVAATMIALTVLLAFSKNVWVEERRFHISGLFFGLNTRGSLQLACAWLKLIFMLVFIAGFQKLSLIQYMMLLIPGILGSLSGKGIFASLSQMFWFLLQFAGLLSVNLICGYIRDMAGGVGFVLLYLVMGLFLALFSVYLFLNEVNTISVQRDVDAEQIWSQSAE